MSGGQRTFDSAAGLRRKAGLLAMTLAALAIAPSIGSPTALKLASAIGVAAVLALSYNMLLGQTGVLSFGHAVYSGLGGYAAIHLMAAVKGSSLPIPIALMPLVGFSAGLAAGALIGWPSCRRAGTPFAMISLGIGELMGALAFMLVSVFGGEEGVSANRAAGPALLAMGLGPDINAYWFTVFWVVLAVVLMWGVTRTPLGRLANAVRDNPERVQFIGFNPQRVRYAMFMLAGGFAGLAGGIEAVNVEIMTPSALRTHASGLILMMAFIGGSGVFYGPMLGAALIVLMQSMLSDFTPAWQLYLGELFMAVVLLAPLGLGGMLERAGAALGNGPRGRRRLVTRIAGIALIVAGNVLLTELVFRWRDAALPPLRILRLALDPATPYPWLLGGGLILAGLVVLARRRPSPRPAPAPAIVGALT